jgi:hypothetical protein
LTASVTVNWTVAASGGNSPDGSTLIAPATGSLTTSAGTWTWGGAYPSGTSGPGQYYILLNGSSAANGAASELEVDNGGQMYALNSASNSWYVWNGSGWAAASNPNSGGSTGGNAGLSGATTFPTTVSLLNLTAGMPTQTFGQVFHDGDVPVGSVPTLTIGGVAQPFSAGMQAYHPSGCLRFCTLVVNPTVNGNATLTIGSAAGSWPAASGRTAADVYAQNLMIEAPPLTGITGGIGQTQPTTVFARVNGDANTFNVSKWFDGQAGAGFKFSCNMVDTSGTAHPQLKADLYVQALGAGASPLGFRWSGCLRAPDFTATGAQYNFFFAPPNPSNPTAGLNWSANGVARAPTWPFAPATDVTSSVAFVGVGSVTNNVLTITNTESGSLVQGQPITATGIGALNEGCFIDAILSSNTYQLGNLPNGTNVPAGTTFFTPGILTTTQGEAWSTGSQNLVPVQLSGSALPNPLASGQVYWGQINGNSLSLNTNPGGGGSSQVTTAGVFTATPVPGFGYFNRLSLAGPDAKYMYFQGGGTQASETGSRAQQNQLYLQSSGMIPPYDPALTGTSMGGSLPDTTYPFPWNPYNQGTVPNNINQWGDGSFIGALMNQQVVDFENQSALSEQQIRILGWAGGLMPYDLKDHTLGTVLNMTGNTYAGLPASNLTISWDGANANGFTIPGPSGANVSGPMGMNAADSSHMPFFCFWPYLRTGELQFFDYLVDTALGGALIAQPNRNPRVANGDSPYDLDGVALYGSGQYRGLGWSNRNLQCAALLAPYNPTTPTALDFDGTQRSKMLNDVADYASNILIDTWNYGKTNPAIGSVPASFVTPYMQSASMWMQYNYDILIGGPGYNIGPFWEQCYVGLGECYAAARGNTKAVEFLSLLGARAAYVGQTYGFFPLYHYNQATCLDQPAAPYNIGVTPISADYEYTISQISAVNGNPADLGWTTGAGPACFYLDTQPNNGYVPQNGDVITPYDGNGVFRPTEIADAQFYQIIDFTLTPAGPNYATFGLAPYGSTTAIPISSGTGSEMVFNYMPSNPGPQFTYPYAGNFAYQVGECAVWATKMGAANWATCIADEVRRNQGQGFSFGGTGDPYNTEDYRYIVLIPN